MPNNLISRSVEVMVSRIVGLGVLAGKWLGRTSFMPLVPA